MRSDQLRYTSVASPVGPLLLVADEEGLCGLYMESQKYGRRIEASWRRDDASLSNVTEQLAAYFARELEAFDLALSLQGTEFQKQVWQTLVETPLGRTSTYAEVAERVGAPSATRAVGAAVGRNPVGIIVPCHRIVGSDGRLTGYAGGLDRKRWLLEHEGVCVENGRLASNTLV
jgi:methylated-DNA-[protein]-cysteine S-methyltransferase